ncbi:MAG: Fe-S protein assembly co-chaperone HscB [Saprospiraceae bacterium]
MTYFDLYELPISFKVEKGALKRKFYELSRKYHPDFYTQEEEAKQNEILELSSMNNEAYKILKDFDKRMKYVLELKGILAEEGKNTIPQDFLMEMMDINENLMELEFDYDEAVFNQVQTDLTSKETTLYNEIEHIVEGYQEGTTTKEELMQIKKYYFKRKYLLRIKENLSKFASL